MTTRKRETKSEKEEAVMEDRMDDLAPGEEKLSVVETLMSEECMEKL